MIIMITNRCHMECPHCMQDSNPDGKQMTDETFEQVLRLVREAQPLVVNVSGGEPTEHPKWKEYVKELLKIDSVRKLGILTNGAWIDDSQTRLKMAGLVRQYSDRIGVQVYSHPDYYQDHDWTVEHEAQYRSIGCIPDFNSPIFMQDLGRARENCKEEVAKSDYVPSCINSHLIALQSHSLSQFLSMAAIAGKFYRPLIDPEGYVHMSESHLCPSVAHVSEPHYDIFAKMRKSRPCKGCQLYKNFEELHPREMEILR